jgi:hypothetical protein
MRALVCALCLAVGASPLAELAATVKKGLDLTAWDRPAPST